MGASVAYPESGACGAAPPEKLAVIITECANCRKVSSWVSEEGRQGDKGERALLDNLGLNKSIIYWVLIHNLGSKL